MFWKVHSTVIFCYFMNIEKHCLDAILIYFNKLIKVSFTYLLRAYYITSTVLSTGIQWRICLVISYMLTEGDKQLGNKGIHKIGPNCNEHDEENVQNEWKCTLGNVSLRCHLIWDMKNRKVTVMQGNWAEKSSTPLEDEKMLSMAGAQWGEGE